MNKRSELRLIPRNRIPSKW